MGAVHFSYPVAVPVFHCRIIKTPQWLRTVRIEEFKNLEFDHMTTSH